MQNRKSSTSPQFLFRFHSILLCCLLPNSFYETRSCHLRLMNAFCLLKKQWRKPTEQAAELHERIEYWSGFNRSGATEKDKRDWEAELVITKISVCNFSDDLNLIPTSFYWWSNRSSRKTLCKRHPLVSRVTYHFQ